MNNRSILILIAVLMVGIFGILAYDRAQDNRSPMEKISDSVSEVGEEIKDEIDDNTTGN